MLTVSPSLTCTGPPPPTGILPLCNVVVWDSPYNPEGNLIGYAVQFYIPGTQNEKVRVITQNRAFYVVQDEDKFDRSHSVFTKVICTYKNNYTASLYSSFAGLGVYRYKQ